MPHVDLDVLRVRVRVRFRVSLRVGFAHVDLDVILDRRYELVAPGVASRLG